MKHITVDGTFASENEAVKNVVENQISKANKNGKLFPVCASQQIGRGKISYGMQFWTAEEMLEGSVKNSDRTFSFLCK